MLNIYYIWCITIILTWLEVTESVTLPWKSTLIISILTFPSINCMQCFDKIPIIGGALSKTFAKPPLCFEDRWWTHLQCKYCFQMQRWQNCLDWLQLPFIDALFSTQFASKHHRFRPLAPFHVRLQRSSHYSFLEFSFQQWNSCHHKSIFKLWWRAVTPDRNCLNRIR